MKKGFTLIEILVVISIIALLSSIVLAALSTARSKAIIAAGQTFEGQMYQAYGANAVAIWNFDEGSGGTANDSSGNHSNLTIDPSLLPAVWTSTAQAFRGKSALNFPGNSIVYPASANVTGFTSANGSVSFWINLTKSSEAGGVFCSDSPYYGLCIDGSNHISGNFIQVGWLNAAKNAVIYVASNLSADSFIGKWTQVAVSWSVPNIKIYVNGNQVASSSLYVASSFLSSPKFCVGGDCEGIDVNGTLDEMRVYSQSLQTGEIQKIYAEELPRHEHLLADVNSAVKSPR